MTDRAFYDSVRATVLSRLNMGDATHLRIQALLSYDRDRTSRLLHALIGAKLVENVGDDPINVDARIFQITERGRTWLDLRDLGVMAPGRSISRPKRTDR